MPYCLRSVFKYVVDNAIVDEATANQDRESRAEAIRADPSLDEKSRRKALQALGKAAPTSTSNSASIRAIGDIAPRDLEDVIVVRGVDLGIARLRPFDSKWCVERRVLKDAAKGYPYAASLCTLGFPFYACRCHV